MDKQQDNRKLNRNPLFLRILGLGKPYFVKTPWWLRKIYYRRLWHVNTNNRSIYLTFDDGPHEIATPFVLDTLKQFDARATFFCIGRNVNEYPHLYQRILNEGHAVGNHTQHHLNGWQTGTQDYLNNVAEAAKYIESELFRPPYGRISSIQAKGISRAMNKEKSKIVMWDVLSGDFDELLPVEKCFRNVIDNTTVGSIIVFHETENAVKHLEYSLPKVLTFFTERGFQFKSLLGK